MLLCTGIKIKEIFSSHLIGGCKRLLILITVIKENRIILKLDIILLCTRHLFISLIYFTTYNTAMMYDGIIFYPDTT